MNGTTDTEVRELFEKYGTVTEAVVISGYGFVVGISTKLFVLTF
jgi:RNA recognition motif. (a.k.a. RRM, RBD, or RNP domain)